MATIRTYKEYPPIDKVFDLYQDESHAVFLDSSLRNSLGRYSIIGIHPYMTLVNGEQFTLNDKVMDCTFEEFLKDHLKGNFEENKTGLPIVSGAIGYFSYDYGLKKEGLVSRHEKEVEIPDCVFCFYDVFIIEDHQEKQLHLVANGQGMACEARLDIIETQITDIKTKKPQPGYGQVETKVEANFSKNDYLCALEKMIDYIIEGDIYIANMTQKLRIKSPCGPYELFKKLRQDNPSPFGGYFNYDDFQVVCASPERFLKMTDRHVVTRPIKGTRKRGTTRQEDEMNRQELANSQKDKSELLMIVDLERNDLNKVCIPGTVKVGELFTVEQYATVFHLVSNIDGDLEEGLTAMDLIGATFPGGSITGAPKLRAMEVIDELEHGRRDLYTGSMGYMSLDGNCDFNIVIRTVLYQNGTYHLGVGGGITCESILEDEYEETMQKAKAILESLKIKEMER
ncbi:MAG: aminodeoxychorismate synthase component I [Erysipelotrichaceae bacterium]|nr:aminodeoxychorismate synthase component I [Erysipelotrichaceae bacterium]